jgi:glycosyltransferase involved in cell wall biosynthesis
MNKHILIIGCKNYPAFSSPRIICGGMEVYVDELLKHLRRHYDFTLISGYSTGDGNVKVCSVPLIGGFALQPISLLVFSFFISMSLVVFRRRIDLVNAQTPLSGLIGLILKKVFGIPYVVSVHIFASAADHAGAYSRVYGAIENVVLKNADRVVAAGHELKKFLDNRYGFHKDHVVVITPGMDLVDLKATEASDSVKAEIQEGVFTLLFMGRLIEENGLLDLLEAVKILREKPVRLLIAGSGNLEARVRDFVVKENLQDKITLLGVVKGGDKQFLIGSVGLSIRTSYHEVFPVAYLESIAAGVPVVATPVGDTKHMAERTGAITIVPIKQPHAVALAIEKHIEAGPLPRTVIDRCQAFIKSISWGEQAERTGRLFDDVIGADASVVSTSE